MTGESYDKRRTRSQFQNENLSLFQENPLLLERCYKLPERCFMMVRSDQQFYSLKNNETLDHVTQIEKLEGKIYMESPKGYIDSLLTCKLMNSLYGLKKGPRGWNPKFIPFILSKRFERSKIGCKSSKISS